MAKSHVITVALALALTAVTASSAVAESSRVKLEFDYDHAGFRASKKVSVRSGGAWSLQSHTKFVYAGGLLVAELDALNGHKLLRSYVWGQDKSGTVGGAGGVGGLMEVKVYSDASHPNDPAYAKTYWPVYDGNGNVMALVDSDFDPGGGAAHVKKVVATFEYTPFGELAAIDVLPGLGPVGPAGETLGWGGLPGDATPTAICPLLFSTKYLDAETGLYYYGYRYYEPAVAKWLNRDPLAEESGLNLYGFCGNDPIDIIDAFGESFFADVAQWIQKNHSVVGSPATMIVGLVEKISPGSTGWVGDFAAGMEKSAAGLVSLPVVMADNTVETAKEKPLQTALSPGLTLMEAQSKTYFEPMANRYITAYRVSREKGRSVPMSLLKCRLLADTDCVGITGFFEWGGSYDSVTELPISTKEARERGGGAAFQTTLTVFSFAGPKVFGVRSVPKTAPSLLRFAKVM